MQDRTSANSMKVLLQRTAGPYIGSFSPNANAPDTPGMSALHPKADIRLARGWSLGRDNKRLVFFLLGWVRVASPHLLSAGPDGRSISRRNRCRQLQPTLFMCVKSTSTKRRSDMLSSRERPVRIALHGKICDVLPLFTLIWRTPMPIFAVRLSGGSRSIV